MVKGDTPAKNRIKQDVFENLCAIWATKEEIAGFFDVSEDTLESWCDDVYGETFSAIYKKQNSKGKISLRRSQLQSATKGNVSMQIWLGKQYLNQKENIVVENETMDKLDELLEAQKNA